MLTVPSWFAAAPEPDAGASRLFGRLSDPLTSEASLPLGAGRADTAVLF